MNVKVCKFGGTSMADGNVMRSVKSIVESDESRAYIVVSAPGKRFGGDVKVTDLLYGAFDALESGDENGFKTRFGAIRTRFLNIEKELAISADLSAELDRAEAAILAGAGRDYCASRGEYLTAKLIAVLLNAPFIDAEEIFRFKADGTLDEITYKKTAAKLLRHKRAVVPGFYGMGADGKIKTFTRGGGDISGAVVAYAVKASLYENWTDVSGFFVCDPKIVSSPECIEELSYPELRELSYMGASVLHSESVFPVKNGGIPIQIRNTFRPQDEGTLIVPDGAHKQGERVVTGIAGKKDFTVIFLEKSMMNGEIGFAAKMLEILNRHGVAFEHLPSGIDTMSLVIDNKYLENGKLNELVEEINAALKPDKIHTRSDVALIATVGHGIANDVTVPARLFKALAEADVHVLMIDQGSGRLNIIVGVANADLPASIRAIYREFFN